MKITFDILRRQSPEDEPYHQRIPFETDDEQETVATALQKINASTGWKDETGHPVEPISWEVGCLQKKCGACAMLINRQPRLACDTYLKEFRKDHRRGVPADNAVTVTLEPLSKFPVVKDLITDRSILFDNLKLLRVWSGERAEIKEKNLDRAYDASRCLQCGCCLEICPNYRPGGSFVGAAGYAPQARLITTYSKEEQKELRKLYQKHVYSGCGKSLSCMKVCPAGIDLDRLLSQSNAISIWRR